MTQQSDWYQVLGVSCQADTSEIHRAWRSLVRAHHPDVGGDVDRFLQIQSAWAVLGDPVQRRRFDREQQARARADADERLRRTRPEPSATRPTHAPGADGVWDPRTYPMTPAAAAAFRAGAPQTTEPAQAPRRRRVPWPSRPGGIAVLPWALLTSVAASVLGRVAAECGVGARLWATSGAADGTGLFSAGAAHAVVLLIALAALGVLLTGAPRPKVSAAGVAVWAAVAVWLLPWLGAPAVGTPMTLLGAVAVWFGSLGAICAGVVSARHYRGEM